MEGDKHPKCLHYSRLCVHAHVSRHTVEVCLNELRCKNGNQHFSEALKSDVCGPKEDSKRCQCQDWDGSSSSQMQDLFYIQK